MSYATKFERQFDYLSYQNANPTRPLPGDKVNIDLNYIVGSIDEIIEFQKLIQRSDGALKNGIVTLDSLATAVRASLGQAEALDELLQQLATTLSAATDAATAANNSANDASNAVVSSAANAAEADASATAAAASATSAEASATSAAASAVAAEAAAQGVGYNVVSFGADPTGVLDSAAAIQDAIDAAAATPYGGVVLFPPGTFKVGTRLEISTMGITLRGSGRLTTYLQGVGTTQPLIRATASHTELDMLCLMGPNNTVMTGGYLVEFDGVQGGKISNCQILNSYVALYLHNSTNNQIIFNKFYNVYGPQWVLLGAGSGGNAFRDNQLDSPYYTSVTFTLGAALGAAWQASHGYSAGNVIANGGNYYVCTASGTSAGSGGPTGGYFGQSIIDNTARWNLLAPTNQVLLDMNGTAQNYVGPGNDFTSVCAVMIKMTGCNGDLIAHNQGGAAMAAFVQIAASNTFITIDHNNFAYCNGVGILDSAASSESVTIQGNQLYNMASYGIQIGGATLNVSGNVIYAPGQISDASAILFYAGTLRFVCAGNTAVKGAAVSADPMIWVQSGASNHYNITNNIGNGFGGGAVVDQGSGGNKTVSGNW